MRYCGFGIGLVVEEDIRGSSVCSNWLVKQVRSMSCDGQNAKGCRAHTGSIHRQIKVLDRSKLAKNLMEMIVSDIFRQTFHDNLESTLVSISASQSAQQLSSLNSNQPLCFSPTETRSPLYSLDRDRGFGFDCRCDIAHCAGEAALLSATDCASRSVVGGESANHPNGETWNA